MGGLLGQQPTYFFSGTKRINNAQIDSETILQ